jgi:hypothetical protein
MKHEKPGDVSNQDRVGEILAETLGMTWEPEHGEYAPVDGYLHDEGCVAAVEVKWREKRYADYRVDADKVAKLLAHANAEKLLAILAVRVPGVISMRVLSDRDLESFDRASMTLNKPRDDQDIDDDVIVYPWSAFQIVRSK